MRNKFTNQELYNWMISQISAVYFQSYKIACDLAKRAERALQQELGVTDSGYIQPVYWDNLKKGSLAGEKLGHDIKRMEVAYLEQNRREYEITNHVSLPNDFRQFDYDTISDVVMHVRYTAREGGGTLKQAAVTALTDGVLNSLPLGEKGERTGLFRLFSAKHEFPNRWHHFLHPADDQGPHTLDLETTRNRFPFMF